MCLRFPPAPRNFAYCSSIAASRLGFRSVANLAGLLANFLAKQVTQPGARLVQLRFGIPDRTTHNSRNLVVLVTLNVVQNKDGAIPWRKLLDGTLEIDTIDGPTEPQIRSSHILARPAAVLIGLGGFLQGGDRKSLFPEAHEHDVDGHAMQPGGKGRLAAKGGNLAEQLQKSLLHQVFRVGRIADHAQAEGIDPAAASAA